MWNSTVAVVVVGVVVVELDELNQLPRIVADINRAEVESVGRAVVQEAQRAKEEGKEKVILFNWSGHGLVDLAAYDAFLSGKLTQYELPEEEIQRALRAIEKFPKP